MDIYEVRRQNLIKLIADKCQGKDSVFAKKIGKDASYITRCKYPQGKAGKKRIGDEIVEAIKTNFDLPAGWMDVLDNDYLLNTSKSVSPYRPLLEQNDNGIYLPLLNIRASMGKGAEFKNDDLVIDVLRVTKSWVDKTLRNITDIGNLSFIHAIGDSMHPTFNDGDILLVDGGVKNVSADSVYVLEAHDRLFIKRVRRRIDGTYEISSDNPAVKTVDVLNGDTEVLIKGRVVWVWNGKKV